MEEMTQITWYKIRQSECGADQMWRGPDNIAHESTSWAHPSKQSLNSRIHFLRRSQGSSALNDYYYPPPKYRVSSKSLKRLSGQNVWCKSRKYNNWCKSRVIQHLYICLTSSSRSCFCSLLSYQTYFVSDTSFTGFYRRLGSLGFSLAVYLVKLFTGQQGFPWKNKTNKSP